MAQGDDPLVEHALEVLNGLAERYTKIGSALSDAARQIQADAMAKPGDSPLDDEPSGIAGMTVSQTVEGFRERLEGVFGVSKVSVVSEGPDRYRFIVEMKDPAAWEPDS